ncbi:STAS domain-containing protein [Cohnella sp. JJ-181]|uniref:STAS domain-containing protein n=1 Tax=Cohnella rhizoplanae TaxID=2974897 RepID=UPI0022FFB9AA|nr:STAS domain-containing protein [Cohnella sp. JJ-181]CAI6081371.1 Putative anti-sigma factor antagonist BtrV [Cohnella sp. JJ-181]
MNLTAKATDGVAILSIEGRLDGQNASEAEAAFAGLAAEGHSRFVLDFSALQYISSAGLRVVLVAAKKTKAIKGSLICAGMNEAVREVFEMSGLLGILETADTADEAAGRLASR